MDRLDMSAVPDADAAGSSSQPADQSPTEGSSKDGVPPPKKQSVRKRTKTGCLTCRKRRIKCDEGKPTCSNCIKSKRHCEGYNQRVVFKEPIGTFHHGGPFGPIVYQQQQQQQPPPPPPPPPPQPADQLINAQLTASQGKTSSPQGGPLPIIAPKPPQQDFTAHHYQAHQGPASHGPLNMSPGYQRFPPDAAFMPRTPSIGEPQLPGYRQDESPLGFTPVQLGRPDSGLTSVLSAAPLSSPDLAGPASMNASKLLQGAMVAEDEEEYWYSDDDASMAESDDGAHMASQSGHLESNDQGVLVAQKMHGPADIFGTQMRTFSNFGEENALDTYIPTSTNSPLNDAQTASVFHYFVSVTGPSMSLYERHPFDPTPMFQGQPVPKARQHNWTYTFPIIALNHPALQQAMLALASLQMAKLQGVPATAAMKHYHLSIRRIAKNYQTPGRRVQPATLATTMLLGFYEVWNSDHDKWCKHMWGARAIIREHNIGEMTRGILAMRRKRQQRLEELRNQQPYDAFTHVNLPAENVFEGVNTALLSQISGKVVNYDEPHPMHSSRKPPRRYTDRDVETYELVRDLFWWYCKMDVYQSFLGATPLLMSYDLWTECTPRAPIGRIDAVFGTFDHLMLLLGRLASFAVKDANRKRRAKKADGSGPPGGPQSHSSPPFAGMMPSRGEFTIPKGFSPPRDPTPQSEKSEGGAEEFDPEASMAAAVREWNDIYQAFELFQNSLGPDFEPLGPEYEPPMETPFGTTLTYRTYSIAGVWMNFYMGWVVLHRSHPAMPPVAMIAAGMAAEKTAPYANQIGRIAAGLVADDCTTVTAVSTLVGAAFIESSFPIFVAGVQYREPSQRHWVIRRLHDIARLTGWQSARQIAGGCEAAWTRAASMGRGPPYHPPPELIIEVPQSVWTRPRRIDERIKELTDDNEKVVLSSSERPQYALGLLSMEEDLKKLDLREDS